jgi:uncharacterized protein YmfQ (DUF2313 family)
MMTEQKMHSNLPAYYDEVHEMDVIVSTEAKEFDDLEQNAEDTLNQSFVDFATWGLDRWEGVFGLSSDKYTELTWDVLELNVSSWDEMDRFTWDQLYTAPFVERPYDDRRGAIKAKIRGHGVVTKAFLKNLVESFTNGEVEIIEDPPRYTVTIKFVSTVGIPANYDTVKQIVREILPAHYAVEYTNEYTIWNDLRATTWGNLAKYTWGDVKGGLWNA